MLNKLKKFRIGWQIFFIIAFFILSYLTLDKIAYESFFSLQLFPTLIGLIMNTISLFVIFLILNAVFLLIFGRVYCSFLCPFGIIQDFFDFVLSKVKILKPVRKVNHKTTLWISSLIFVLFTAAFFFNYKIIVAILEPFSVSAKIPYALKTILSDTNIIAFTYLWGLYFLIIFVVTAFRRRFFCLYMCPTGFILRMLSKLSLLRLDVNRKTCIECHKCEISCKTSCINIDEFSISNSLCIRCFNCLAICPVDAISFRRIGAKSSKSITPVDGDSRRNFLKKTLSVLLVFVFSGLIKLKGAFPFTHTFDETKTFPPGGRDINKYLDSCINCYMCVDKCPTNVLQPSENFPVLEYSEAFCDYFCNECSKVCPTDAISYIPLKEKQKTALGKSGLNKNICVVFTKNQSCGACAEICPTGAVHMIEYKENLKAPEIDNTQCVGCGSCEYACPTRPIRAIQVQPFKNHKELAIKDQGVEKEASDEKFPF